MTAPAQVFGVGVRRGQVFLLDAATGLPYVAAAGTLMDDGVRIGGIKTFSPTDPEPQLITHYGDDRPLAQDSLPPTEVMSVQITAAKDNFDLDAAVGDLTVRNYTLAKFILANTNKKGLEPQVAVFTVRQALAGDEDTPSEFGTRRVWETRTVPSARMVSIENAFEQGATDKTYSLIPTPVKSATWGELFTENNWGATEGQYIKGVWDYRPVFGVQKGNGTITSYVLPANPYSATTTLGALVWVDGTQVTPATLTTTGQMTLSAAPGVDDLVFVAVLTQDAT